MSAAPWEQALCALDCLLPNVFLALYPFRRRLRHSAAASAGLIGALCLIQGFLGLWASASSWQGTAALLSTCAYGVFLCLLVKAHWGKCLFTMLMLSNLGNFIFVAAKCAEGLLFPALAGEPCRWSFTLMNVLVQGAVLVPLYFYFRRSYTETMERAESQAPWGYLWLIPLTFYSVWFRNFYFSAEGAAVLALRPRHVLYSAVVNGGGMLVNAMVARLMDEQAENRALLEREHQLALQQALYESLQERIEEARRATHDLRQHVHVIDAYLKDGDSAALREYIGSLQRSLPEEGAAVYCENYRVNALLQFFARQAQAEDIAFTASVRLPRDAGIPDDALTVVLGNLLENALEACAREETPAISVRGTADEAAVFFKVRNTSTHPALRDEAGYYLSAKHPGRGIGLKSVQDITARCGGLMRVEEENDTFTVSVLLNIPYEEP